MSRKHDKQKSGQRRPLFGEGSWLDSLWGRIRRGVKNVANTQGLAEEDEAAEPIDFSTPSIPYYISLADKFHLARIVLYMVLFAFLAVTLLSSRQVITYENLYYLVKDIDAANITAKSQVNHLSYPLSQATPDFARFRGGLVIAGGDEITALSGSGKQTLSDNVSMTTPCVSAGGQYFIVYSRGEKNFTVYNAFAKMHKEVTDYPVYDACMGDDGSFGVLSRSMDYTSEVTWYDDDMSRLAACHIGGYVVSMAMSPDSRTMVVLSMDTSAGEYASKLTILRRDMGGNVTYDEVTQAGAVLGACFLTDDRLCVMGDATLSIYRLDGTRLSEIALDEDMPLLWGSSTGYVGVLCQSQSQLSQKYLKVFDKNGKMVYNVDVSSLGTPKTMVMDGQNVYILDAGYVLQIGHGGEVHQRATVDANTLTLMVSDLGELLILAPAYAYYLSENDFR